MANIHKKRNASILASHPEIKHLQGPEWKSKWIALLLVITQISLACWTSTWQWSARYVLIVYISGATISQSLFLASHELTHGLFFTSPKWNRMFALLVNWPSLIPYVASFRIYHLEHHAHQGVSDVDTDLPSEWEKRWFRGRFLKLVWLAMQLVFYAGRPVLVRPHPLTPHEVTNIISQIIFTCGLYRWAGPGAICFLALSTLLSGGLHPCAGHFLSEHFFMDGKFSETCHDTFSYYGPLNALTWNVGYHNEHHDFPRIPWSRLPRLKELAPEYYDDLPVCPSWVFALWSFVNDPRISLHSRLVRMSESSKDK